MTLKNLELLILRACIKSFISFGDMVCQRVGLHDTYKPCTISNKGILNTRGGANVKKYINSMRSQKYTFKNILFYTFLYLNDQFFEESFAVILIEWLDRR